MIELKIHMDELRMPGVADAMSNLILALGNERHVERTVPEEKPTAVGSGNGVETWDEFYRALTPQTRSLISVLLKQGSSGMSVEELARKLNLACKGIGGLVGAFHRKVKKHGLQSPLKRTGAAGNYRWIYCDGVLSDDLESALREM